MATMDVLQTSQAVLRSPSAERNKEPILRVLQSLCPPQAGQTRALELASGTGQHVVYFADHLPHVSWQPSEFDPKSLQSIRGHLKLSSATNVIPPVVIDTREAPEAWAAGGLTPTDYNLVLCINMIHISEWKATEGLFRGSGVYLEEGGTLATYGPYKRDGVISPDSNVQFDLMLRQQCRDWGLRDIGDLERLASDNAMLLTDIIDLPANNKMLVFKKQPSAI